jgi:BlaI family penicillinase repressor
MKKPDKLPPLSEVQMEIMNAVWDRDEATLGDIWKSLSERRPVARNTVQTLLSRLVDKGWLTYRAEGKIFHYRAAVARESSLSAAAKRFINSAFGGSTEGLMMALLDGGSISRDEAARIRKLIEEAEERGGEK